MTRLCRNLTSVVALILLAGCGSPKRSAAPRETVRDLIADLDLAELQREPGVVDLGTPEARALLGKGWWLDEARDGRTFVWSDGPESELAFFLARSRDIPLTLRWIPFTGHGERPEKVTLVLNGETVGRVTVTAGDKEARVVLPQGHLQAGENLLTLRYAWTRVPLGGAAGITGQHRPAVAWDLLRFETGVDEKSTVRASGGRLALPFGWRINSYLRLPAGAALEMDDLRFRGGQRGELRVTLRPAAGVEREVARLPADRGPSTLMLPDSGSLPVRLSLVAVPEGPGGPAGAGLVLGRPAVVTPPRATVTRAAPAASRQPAPGARPRNVIIYLVDTLRADHLGCYGYKRPVSPRLDAFARDATVFRHTVAQSSWTRPSTTTILTGLLPRTHGVFGHRDALAPQAVTLAERLQARGYHTAGFVTNPNVAPDFGLNQGFEIYHLMGTKHRAATDVNHRAAQWLDTEWKKDAPFFLYLHTMEPHAPYSAPSSFRQRFAPGVRNPAWTRMEFLEDLEDGETHATPEIRHGLQDLYDAEIAANDDAFGALIDLLVRRGLWDDTVVVFVSDHGEELGDHGGWEHGKTLHTEMLEVPLIVRIPGASGRVVERQAQQVDVAPTVLTILGLQIPAGLEGRSLLAPGDGEPRTDPQDTPSFSWLEEISLRSAAVTTPEWRLIEKRFPIPGSFLYDRRADPGELHNLAIKWPVRAGYLRAQLRAAERSRQGVLQTRESPPESRDPGPAQGARLHVSSRHDFCPETASSVSNNNCSGMRTPLRLPGIPALQIAAY
jgi:arylsulfatase A-like enzyme